MGYTATPESNSEVRSTNPVIEKALSRVRRASENAKREFLPKIEPVTRSSYKYENEATARALESLPEPPAPISPHPIGEKGATTRRLDISRRSSPIGPATAASPAMAPALADPAAKAPVDAQPSVVQVTNPPRVSDSQPEEIEGDAVEAFAIDEIEPLDYLEAEMRKVDRALTAELFRNDAPTILNQAVTTGIDIATVIVASVPFVLLATLYGTGWGAHAKTGTLGILVMIGFFYFAVTQALCGKTFGMMFTGTRVVDALTAQPPSLPRVLLRAAGYIIAAAPFFVGILWGAVSPQRRGWHDYIAGTRVITEF
jgi:uncharacterized RDD family membrane protein YckC